MDSDTLQQVLDEAKKIKRLHEEKKHRFSEKEELQDAEADLEKDLQNL